MLETIADPLGYPMLGNILDVRDAVPINNPASIADKCGLTHSSRLHDLFNQTQ